MPRREKLIEQAVESPSNLRFDELCALAEAFGFVARGGKGSHRIFKREGLRPMSFQDDGGKAKPYQVRQLLDTLRELGEID
jgi:hypothetical protein